MGHRTAFVLGIFIGLVPVVQADVFVLGGEDAKVLASQLTARTPLEWLFRLSRKKGDIHLEVLDAKGLTFGAARERLDRIRERMDKQPSASTPKALEEEMDRAVAAEFKHFGGFPALTETKWVEGVTHTVDAQLSGFGTPDLLEKLGLGSMATVFDVANYDSASFFDRTYMGHQSALLVERARRLFVQEPTRHAGVRHSSTYRDEINFYKRQAQELGVDLDPQKLETRFRRDLNEAWMWGKPPGVSAKKWGHDLSRDYIDELSRNRYYAGLNAHFALMESEMLLRQMERAEEQREAVLGKTKLILLSWLYAQTFVKTEFVAAVCAMVSEPYPHATPDIERAFTRRIDDERFELYYEPFKGRPIHEISKEVLAEKLTGVVVKPFEP